MSWKNERETLTKCEQCGRFANEGEAYYAPRSTWDKLALEENPEQWVYPYCSEKCAQEGQGKEVI